MTYFLCESITSHYRLKLPKLYSVSSNEKRSPGFKSRFAWFVVQSAVVLANTWGYALFGVAFTYISPNYQWILGLLSPLPKVISIKLLLYVSFKSAGKESHGKSSIRDPCMHFMETKHCVFTAIIVGGVATPLTRYCILGVRCFISIFRCLKLIYGQYWNEKNLEDESK